MKSPYGSSVANRALELLGTELGMFRNDGPVKPLTLEAEILHFADDASAKTASINEAYALKENFPDGEGISAKKIWQLDGRWMYKGNPTFGR